MTGEIHAEVTFYLKDGRDVLEKLTTKARQIDEDNGNLSDAPDEYTIPQALQVVWHNDPEWLHDNVLDGWTLDRAPDEAGTMRPIWGRP